MKTATDKREKRAMTYARQCQHMGCTNLIDPKRRTAKFCSDACRQADGREMRKNKPPVLCSVCKKALSHKE
jgi:hypothetical protein